MCVCVCVCVCISDHYYVKINWLIGWCIVNSVTLIDVSSAPIRIRNSYLKVNDCVCFRTEINQNVFKRSVPTAK